RLTGLYPQTLIQIPSNNVPVTNTPGAQAETELPLCRKVFGAGYQQKRWTVQSLTTFNPFENR
ncbi:MAG: hypothetical protein IJQ26_04905, partial [Lachnospiraceae bacterium]|nr:hypothetical protein [Lachnospiraceae bacterium]